MVERSDTTGPQVKSMSHPGGMPVLTYIDSQEEHHRVKSFREELIEMLDKAGIEYDPKYLD